MVADKAVATGSSFSQPVEFEDARRWLAGREDVGDRALKLSDEEAFDAIRSRYIGGWHAFVTERARAGR